MGTPVPTGKKDTSPWPTHITGLDGSINDRTGARMKGPGGQHVEIPQMRYCLLALRMDITTSRALFI
jgi:hypothetical protein